eukprot:3911833-Rhodomonas_salina.1
MWSMLKQLTLIVLIVSCDAFGTPANFYTTHAKSNMDFADQRHDAVLRDAKFRKDLSRRNYHCEGCLKEGGGGERTVVRVMFVEGKDVVENPVAAAAAEAAGNNYECGSCCSDPERALPECFVAENWKNGWISKPTLRILQRTGGNIVALTSVNITDEARSLSFEQHPYALCPIEVLLGNVDLCVGDWWESISRRSHVKFST